MSVGPDNGGIPNEVTWRQRAKARSGDLPVKAQAATQQPLSRNQSMHGGAIQMATGYEASGPARAGSGKSLAEQLGLRVQPKKATQVLKAAEDPAPAPPADEFSPTVQAADEFVPAVPPAELETLTLTASENPIVGPAFAVESLSVAATEPPEPPAAKATAPDEDEDL